MKPKLVIWKISRRSQDLILTNSSIELLIQQIVEFFPVSIVKVKNFPGDTSKIIANDVEQLVSDKLNCLIIDVGTNE